MLRFVFVVLPLLLGIYALVDCVQTPAPDTRGLPRLAWLPIIVVPIVGPLLWLTVGRRRETSLLSLIWPSDEARPSSPRGSGAPDDDLDFLRGLGRRPPRSQRLGRPAKRDEDDLLAEWERDLRGGDGSRREGDDNRGGPDDDGPESSTDGAPRV
jgi:hypothetical protein